MRNYLNKRRAFTLIELLVSIAIIAVLMSLVFVGANLLQKQVKRASARGILAKITVALSLCKASGRTPSLIEHPLAASFGDPRTVGLQWMDSAQQTYLGTCKRAYFIRENPADQSSYPQSLIGEALVAPEGVGLSNFPATLDPWCQARNPPPYRNRVLLGSDRLDENQEVPHLYGMERRYLKIIGAGLWDVTWYRQLPKLIPGPNLPSTTPTYERRLPAGATCDQSMVYYPQLLFCYGGLAKRPPSWYYTDRYSWEHPGYLNMITGGKDMFGAGSGDGITDVLRRNTIDNQQTDIGGRIIDHRRAFQDTLSFGGALKDLESIGAIEAPPDGSDEEIPPAAQGSNAMLFRSKRLWYDPSFKARWNIGVGASWKPGLVKDPSPSAAPTPWKPYRLRGPAIYDPWGTEILVSQQADGSWALISAGPDKVFRFLPGVDGVYQTAANAGAPSGDDRDASLDNISYRSVP